MEEINALFGDEVVVHLSDATEKQRSEVTAKVLAEDERREFATQQRHNSESVSTTAELKA